MFSAIGGFVGLEIFHLFETFDRLGFGIIGTSEIFGAILRFNEPMFSFFDNHTLIDYYWQLVEQLRIEPRTSIADISHITK